LIRQGNVETKMTVEALMKGAVWSLLLVSGYLKVVERQFSSKTRRFTYRLELADRCRRRERGRWTTASQSHRNASAFPFWHSYHN
jgi:hypothetical protein